jgi:hypothetical protein
MHPGEREQSEFNFSEGQPPAGAPKETDSNTSGTAKEGEKGPRMKFATEEERIHCQYCEDVGPCQFCKRGKAEAARLRLMPKKKLK